MEAIIRVPAVNRRIKSSKQNRAHVDDTIALSTPQHWREQFHSQQQSGAAFRGAGRCFWSMRIRREHHIHPITVDVMGGLNEEQWFDEQDLGEDYHPPELNPVSYLPRHLQWQCNNAKGEEDRGNEEIIRRVRHEACPRAITLEEIQVAMDADICPARTRVVLHRKQWANFMDNAKALIPINSMIITQVWRVRNKLSIDEQV